ncbi:MAG TPA: arylamine N-acetyltransferase [Polyangiales bacterium]|nr:arylamine N-acetyltransferase [Polyangiales bacterium]
MSFDLDEYLERIAYDGPREPTLHVLHALTAAHSQTIPFENLDVMLGRPVRLELDAVHDKLVRQRRGGYCFEQNGLFLHVLAQLGFTVLPLSARVRLQRPRDFTPPRTHLFVRVELEGQSWLTDVGVGAMSLTSALRLVLDVAQETPHEPRRIVHEQGRFFHQAYFAETWNDVYEFTLEQMPPIDRELGNWYTSTHPSSHFRTATMVARAAPDGARITLLNRELSFRQRDGRADKRELRAHEVEAALLEHFGLRLPEGARL